MESGSSRGAPAPAARGWRTRDIVVTAVIGVVFGVVFQVWNAVWAATPGLFAFFPPAQNLFYGVWLMPAILAPLVVRKPGAALFAEVVAAGLSAVIGNQFGPDALLSGVLQGAAAELVFLATRYRHWAYPALALASLASALAAWAHDWVVWFAATAVDVQLWVGACMAVSAVVLTAGGSLLLARSLRRAGVLEGFPAG